MMEFAGRSASQQMQLWIQEEFAYISSKRERRISDIKEEQKIRQELQLPVFYRRNLEDWILQLEDFFYFFQLNEEAKLKAAIITLDGDA